MTRCVAVIVTYNPDLAILRRQVRQLGTMPAVLVDNASSGEMRARLRELCGGDRQPALVLSGTNVGLAAGLNVGAREALERYPGCEFLLFLDQDTEPGMDGVARLLQAVDALRAADRQLGLAGPLMVDADTGVSHGVHVIRGWRWIRVYPTGGEALRCVSVNGSGSLVPARVFVELGGYDESLFVDHVDTEWSFRVAAAGYHLYTLPAVRFMHRMGEHSVRFWLGRWRVWPYRSPARHYTLFRNAVRLMGRPYVPRVWKAWCAVKLLVTAAVHICVDPARWSQAREMLRGIRQGLAEYGRNSWGP